ncbi:paraquat-inducible protein A [Pedobacter psychrophilus]|uniref:Paraquat-inducible protein A n=1 Tax=Pedobacter psychrophilus TaxID=1826909 RepID=A0A179DMS8_9SPHI|nr:paraquat-inducible protein A [Pedobacter psychrophilus]OAQ42092.1 paraquat-inducible protein A [Pedobacter psychrophilus]
MQPKENPRPPKKSLVFKLILIFGLAALLVAEGYFGFRLHELSKQQEEIKTDYTNVNNITFGLFSAEQWRDKISGILNKQVRNFSLNKYEKRQLQTEVEEVIYALIDQAEALIEKKPQTFKGKIRKLAIKKFVDMDTIKSQVPSFARAMIAKINNSANKNQISTLAMSKFNEVEKTNAYIDSTLTANDSTTNILYNKYQVKTSDQLNVKLLKSLENIKASTYYYCFAMLACIIVVLMLWWLIRKRTELHAIMFIMSLLFAFILLDVGLTASMIEVDARIGSLDFVLLGEHVVFENQVLFFQSKSILDVVEILIKQPEIDSILVGVLILVFSILFPITKLSSTGIHLLGKKSIAESKFVRYFAFQSGKWSMADVIVIAILMVYIGLNGLLESQLANLNIKSDFLTIITTNNTALQPGYIIFISFVLYGLMLSTILKYITPHDAH